MKKVEAIVRPECVEAVKTALREAGHNGVTVLSARGHGAQGGLRQSWRLKEYVVDLIPKALVIAVVDDERLEDVLEAIAVAAGTGRMGDGKVFVYDVIDAMRIRTRERGCDVLKQTSA